MAAWQWALALPVSAAAMGPVNPGGIIGILASARQRRYTVRLDATQSHEASFTLNGLDPEASLLTDLATDLVVTRNNVLLPRCRIMATADTLDGTRHDVAVTAKSYREVLRRRNLMNSGTLSYTSIDQATIAWNLVNYTQGQPGGGLGITQGIGTLTGVTRTVTYAKTDFIADKIGELAAMDNGFDWDISPYGIADQRLDIWYPQRGTARGVVVELGGALVDSITRNMDPSSYANADYVTGDSTVALTPQIVTQAGIATAPEGRWEQAIGTNIKVQAALNSRANWELLNSMIIAPTYQVTLAAGMWGGPAHIWIGDIVRLRINSGRLVVDQDIRVVEMDITPGDNNDENVSLTLSEIPRHPPRTMPKMILDLNRASRYLLTR